MLLLTKKNFNLLIINMKIEILFKNPDALEESVKEALEDLKIDGVSDDELERVKESRKEEILELCNKWFEYGEYLKVEVDTERKTCEVVEVEE